MTPAEIAAARALADEGKMAALGRVYKEVNTLAAQLRAACDAVEAERARIATLEAGSAEEEEIRANLEDAAAMDHDEIATLRAQLAQRDARLAGVEGLVEAAYKEGWLDGEGCNELESDWRDSNARAALAAWKEQGNVD